MAAEIDSSFSFEKLMMSLQDYLNDNVSASRRDHVQRVEQTAQNFAQKFAIDPNKALIASRAHDMAREWPNNNLLKYCAHNGLAISDFEKSKPVLLHGKVAAHLLAHQFGYYDHEVESAVSHHTLGHPGMGELAKLLFVADYIEPGRSYADSEWRQSLNDLDLNCLLCRVICHGFQKHGDLDTLTAQLFKKARGECKQDLQSCADLAQKVNL